MTLHYADEAVALHQGDALDVLRQLPDGHAAAIITSPPYYGLRNYGIDGQYGLEDTPAAYVETMRSVFAEARRVLATDGTLWVNIGDSYNAYNGNRGASPTGFSRNAPLPIRPAGSGLTVKDLPAKSLLGIPWRLAFALQNDGWILRNGIVWHKPNAMPESVNDRLSNRHELLFLFTRSTRYWFDLDPIREPLAREWDPARNGKTGHTLARGVAGENAGRMNQGLASSPPNPAGRNPGDVWSIPTRPFNEAHFATMPLALAERCVQAGAKPGGIVLDPFSGSGTTGLAATRHGRRYLGIDLNPDYLELSLRTRLAQSTLEIAEDA